MPYIAEDDRRELMWVDRALEDLNESKKMSAGELQYVIALAIKHIGPENYQDMNDIMGALAGAQMEFYRRIVAPYEDTKIVLNGDV